MDTLIKVLNYLTFYLIWWLSLWAGGSKRYMFAFLVILLFLAIHILLVSKEKRREALFLFFMATFGFFIETLFSSFDVLSYENGIPFFVFGLWACLGSTYWHSFSWLHGRGFLAAVFGSIGAPVCYMWGDKMHAITFGENRVYSILLLSLVWALVLPITFWVSNCIRKGRASS